MDRRGPDRLRGWGREPLPLCRQQPDQLHRPERSAREAPEPRWHPGTECAASRLRRLHSKPDTRALPPKQRGSSRERSHPKAAASAAREFNGLGKQRLQPPLPCHPRRNSRRSIGLWALRRNRAGTEVSEQESDLRLSLCAMNSPLLTIAWKGGGGPRHNGFGGIGWRPFQQYGYQAIVCGAEMRPNDPANNNSALITLEDVLTALSNNHIPIIGYVPSEGFGVDANGKPYWTTPVGYPTGGYELKK